MALKPSDRLLLVRAREAVLKTWLRAFYSGDLAAFGSSVDCAKIDRYWRELFDLRREQTELTREIKMEIRHG